MRLMTYISPRESPYGEPFVCPPVYMVYNNSRSRKELCARACVYMPVVYRHGPPLPFAVPRILLLFPSFLPSVALFNCLTLLLAISSADPASSCATVNHSACDCVRLITVIRPFSGSGISTANYNHRFLYPVTSLPCFHVASLRPRGCTNERIPARPRKSLSFGSLHPWPVSVGSILYRKRERYTLRNNRAPHDNSRSGMRDFLRNEKKMFFHKV